MLNKTTLAGIFLVAVMAFGAGNLSFQEKLGDSPTVILKVIYPNHGKPLLKIYSGNEKVEEHELDKLHVQDVNQNYNKLVDYINQYKGKGYQLHTFEESGIDSWRTTTIVLEK